MDNNYYKNKIKWCPVCDQGWVQIFKEKSSEKLLILCDECFSEWEKPQLVNKDNFMYSVSNELIIDPTDEEIENKGWGNFLLSASQPF
jgi:hypothetical protein